MSMTTDPAADGRARRKARFDVGFHSVLLVWVLYLVAGAIADGEWSIALAASIIAVGCGARILPRRGRLDASDVRSIIGFDHRDERHQMLALRANSFSYFVVLAVSGGVAFGSHLLNATILDFTEGDGPWMPAVAVCSLCLLSKLAASVYYSRKA
jgi:hypothetical protein